jgi:hypothetical protein
MNHVNQASRKLEASWKAYRKAFDSGDDYPEAQIERLEAAFFFEVAQEGYGSDCDMQEVEGGLILHYEECEVKFLFNA